MNDKIRRDELLQEYWSTISMANPKEAITLESSNAESGAEFHVYGVRIAERFLNVVDKYGATPFAWSTMIDIGCGIGRFALPFSCRFQHVYAVDISKKILGEAKNYCQSVSDISYHVNDGESLKEFTEGSIDYAFCGGVLQHIKYFDVIASYFREAIRVLRVGGLFAASFQIWQSEDIGRGRIGAKITAQKLERALTSTPYKIRYMLIDPKDPMPHCMLILQKTESVDEDDPNRLFSQFAVDDGAFRTGVFEDLPSCVALVEKWKQQPRPITFYDEGNG